MPRQRKGFQQDIDVPTTLGFAPTAWQEPKAPEIQRWTFPTINSGARQEYGSTPGYVDTMPHRWNYGPREKKEGKGLLDTLGKVAEQHTQVPPTPLPPPSGPPAGMSAPPMTPPAGMSAPPMTSATMPAPPSTRKAPTFPAGAGLSVPPIDTGRPTPPPPPTRSASEFPGTARVDTPGAEFMEMIRQASSEPLPVDEEGDPNPFPKGNYKPGEVLSFDSPYWNERSQPITRAPRSRAQNRRPKN